MLSLLFFEFFSRYSKWFPQRIFFWQITLARSFNWVSFIISFLNHLFKKLTLNFEIFVIVHIVKRLYNLEITLVQSEWVILVSEERTTFDGDRLFNVWLFLLDNFEDLA